MALSGTRIPRWRQSTHPHTQVRPFEILLVEDNPGDVRLTTEGLEAGGFSYHLNLARDGVEAFHLLKEGGDPAPDLILLDLNLPRRSGRELLSAIKRDDDLRHIPVVILSTSSRESEVEDVYSLGANCYVTKPLTFDAYVRTVKAIEHFWFDIARLPGR